MKKLLLAVGVASLPRNALVEAEALGITQANVATLKSRGAEFIGPDEGLLSCGYEGVGRLWPVEKIAERAVQLLS